MQPIFSAALLRAVLRQYFAALKPLPEHTREILQRVTDKPPS